MHHCAFMYLEFSVPFYSPITAPLCHFWPTLPLLLWILSYLHTAPHHDYSPGLLLLQILICYKTGVCREICHQPADATSCARLVMQLDIEQLAQSQKGTDSVRREPMVSTQGGSFTYYRFSHWIRTILPACFIMAAYQHKYTREISTSIISHVVAPCLHTSYDSPQAWKKTRNSTAL